MNRVSFMSTNIIIEGKAIRQVRIDSGKKVTTVEQKVIVKCFTNLGFDAAVGLLLQTPSRIARRAVDNDIHNQGISS